MRVRILQVLFAPPLFWLFWQGIDQVSRFLFRFTSMLDAVISLPLILIAALAAWSLGGFLGEKALEQYYRRRPH